MTQAAVLSYLAGLGDERRAALEGLRALILDNLPAGYEEGFNWGMIAYEVPLAASGPTYNGQPLMIAALASQKRHMSLHLPGLHADPALRQPFEEAHRRAGKRLDMGKGCVRFTALDRLDLPAVARVVAAIPPHRLVELEREAHRPAGERRR